MLSIKFSLFLGILHLTAGMTEDYKKTSERLWKVIETNALAPTVSESVHPVCYRSNVSMNQQLVAKQLKQLLEVDASLNDYLTNGQACTGGKNSYFLSYGVSTFKYLMESGRLLLLVIASNTPCKKIGWNPLSTSSTPYGRAWSHWVQRTFGTFRTI